MMTYHTTPQTMTKFWFRTFFHKFTNWSQICKIIVCIAKSVLE